MLLSELISKLKDGNEDDVVIVRHYRKDNRSPSRMHIEEVFSGILGRVEIVVSDVD